MQAQLEQPRLAFPQSESISHASPVSLFPFPHTGALGGATCDELFRGGEGGACTGLVSHLQLLQIFPSAARSIALALLARLKHAVAAHFGHLRRR